MISVGPSAFIFTSCTFSSYTIIIVVQNKTKKSYAWKKSSLHVTSARFKVIKSARSYFNYVTLHLDPKMFSCSLATHTYSLLPSNSLLFQHFEWVFFIIEFFLNQLLRMKRVSSRRQVPCRIYTYIIQGLLHQVGLPSDLPADLETN